MSDSHKETAKDYVIVPKNQKWDVVKIVEETGEKENKGKRATKTCLLQLKNISIKHNHSMELIFFFSFEYLVCRCLHFCFGSFLFNYFNVERELYFDKYLINE
jgi:hypothetical protein